MSIRYDNRSVRTNATKIHKKLLEKRGMKRVQQYTTPIFNDISPSERASLDRVEHIWTVGDRLYKLAFKYYGDSELWWIIAWYNQKPTEADFKIGDLVYIPLPLEDILYMFRRTKTNGGE